MSTSLFGLGSTVNVNVNGSLIPQSFVGTAAQTVFNITSFQYTPGTNSLLVFINGQRQILGRDFTETSATSFTLLEGVFAGDFVDIIGFPQTTLSATTAGSTSFQLPAVGSLSTTLQIRGQNQFFSSDFGHSPSATAAVNDLALAAAILAVYTAGGGILLIPTGSYNHVSVNFTWAAGIGVQIRGAGANSTFLVKTGITTTPLLNFSMSLGSLATYSSLSDISLTGNLVCDGLDLVNHAQFDLRSIVFSNCAIGLSNLGSLIFNVYNCTFNSCVVGYQQDKHTLLAVPIYPNLINFFGGVFNTCSTLGVKILAGNSTYFYGTDIEICGTTNNTATGGIAVSGDVATEIGYGNIGFYGCHFESNKGRSAQFAVPTTGSFDVIMCETIIVSAESGRAFFDAGVNSVTLRNIICGTPGDTVTINAARLNIQDSKIQVLSVAATTSYTYTNLLVNATPHQNESGGPGPQIAHFGGLAIGPSYPAPSTGGTATITTTLPVNAAGSSGGGLVLITGADAASGVAYSRLYLVAIQVNGGAAPLTSATLVASAGNGTATFTFSSTAGVLTISSTTNQGGTVALLGFGS